MSVKEYVDFAGDKLVVDSDDGILTFEINDGATVILERDKAFKLIKQLNKFINDTFKENK